jgi:diacylglycerol kinase family enzyme
LRARETYGVRKRLLLINAGSGRTLSVGRVSTEQLADEARARSLEVRLVEPGDDVEEVARAEHADVLGMAGGDGSLGAVAGVAIERDLPFVCVPFGTRNHFARDAGLDRDDPLGALAAFEGVERRIDVGRVGDRVFLNNVSLGLYARLVHRRERKRRRRELLARGRALASLARHPQPLAVTIDGRLISARVVLVANNAYRLDLFSIGERESLEGGRLHLYAPTGFFRSGWEERTGMRFVVDSLRRSRLRAAVDGEPALLDTPLEFTIEPGALRLLLPPEG